MSFFGKNQYADWRIILSIFFIGFCFAVGFGITLYLDMGDDVDIFSSNPTSVNGKKVKKEVLTNMLERMNARQKAFDDLKINKPIVLDPSL